MKKVLLLLSLVILATTLLSSCVLFESNSPKTVEEYLRSKYINPDETVEGLSQSITAAFREWKLDTESYISPNGTRFSVSTYNIMVQTHSGNMFIINTKEDLDFIANYADPTNGDRVFLQSNNERSFLEAPGTPEKIFLNVYEYDDGYLFVQDEPLLVFLSKDKKDVYVSEDGSNVFTFYGDKTYTLNDTTEIDKLNKDDFYKMPEEVLPDFGNEIKLAYSKISTYFEVYLPYVKPLDAVETLKKNGFSLFQSDTFGIYAENEQDVIFEGTDNDNTISIELSYASPISSLTEEPGNFGTKLIIWDYRYRSAYYQIDLNERDGWSNSQTKALNEIGVELPFTQFGDLLYVQSPIGGCDSHSRGRISEVESYIIKDEYYRPLLENYGDLLIDSGFTKYVPKISEESSKEEIEAWKETDDALYYNCYISEKYNVAIKLGWDIKNGNKIFIYPLN